MVRLLLDQREPARQVYVPGRHQRVVCPQADPLVPGAEGEAEAFVNESRADPVAARGRIDQQDPELRGGLIDRNAEHAPGPSAVNLRDPPRLPSTVRVRGEVGYDPRDQRLEARVPAVLGG